MFTKMSILKRLEGRFLFNPSMWFHVDGMSGI